MGVKGLQAIKERSRKWIESGAEVKLEGRKLDGWIDILKLRYIGDTCFVPSGSEAVNVVNV